MAKTALANPEPAKRPVARRVTEITEAPLVITGVPSVEQVTDVVKSGGKFFYDNDNEGSFLASVLEGATTADELFSEGDLIKVKEHLGETFVLTGIDGVRNSDFDEPGGLGVYLVVSAVDPDGEAVKLAVGQTDAFAKIIALDELDAFPFAVAFERSEKPTKRGFYPINLVKRSLSADGSTF